MLTPEQIREARRLCESAKLYADTALERNLSKKLTSALDTIEAQQVEIERLNVTIDRIWESASTPGMGICFGINCLGRQSCGSPECKKAFMEHYLGCGEP